MYSIHCLSKLQFLTTLMNNECKERIMSAGLESFFSSSNISLFATAPDQCKCLCSLAESYNKSLRARNLSCPLSPLILPFTNINFP